MARNMARIGSAWGFKFSWGLLLIACGSSELKPLAAQDMALMAETNLEHALRGAHQAGSFIADSALLAKTLSSVAGSSCASTAPPCADGAACPSTADTPCETVDWPSVADLQESRQELSDAIDDLVKSLKEKVFKPENLESEDGTSAVYLLSPDTLCTEEDSAGFSAPPPGGAEPTPEPEPPLDSECVERAQRLQPRLRLTSPAPGDVDVSLLLTAAKNNPITLQLHRESVGVVFDLGEIKATMDSIDEPIGNVADGSVAEMRGQLQIELRKNGALDYSFRVNALSALGLTVLDELQQGIVFSLAKSVPAFEIRLDGNARKLIGSYDFGPFDVSGPLNAFVAAGEPAPREKTYTGRLEALLAGCEGIVTFDGQRDKLSWSSLGLGDMSSTLKLDGATLAKLDLNPTAGRHFDLSLERAAEEGLTLAFSPTFDLNLLLNFTPLAQQISDIPKYLLGDTLRIWLDGSAPSVRLEKDQVRVLTGTLSMSSASTPAEGVQIEEGSCLLESKSTQLEHEILSRFRAGPCQ